MRNRTRTLSLCLAAAAAASILLALALKLATPLGAGETPAVKPVYLYKTTFLRAAPGKLLDLIALWKERLPVIEAGGDARPFWWRHTQGDQWDLMILAPMGSYTDYYAKARLSRRDKAAAAAGLAWSDFARRLDACVSWKEDIFVYGPPLAFVQKQFEGMGYFHIEIMVALPGRQDDLYKEREMENAYNMAGGRPYNMIFVRDQGASWDIYTLGCYRDLQHWAAPSPLTKEQKDEAAKKAGFESADAIGPYMRTLIDFHRDTMGVAIR
jgi:hypothetical protein